MIFMVISSDLHLVPSIVFGLTECTRSVFIFYREWTGVRFFQYRKTEFSSGFGGKRMKKLLLLPKTNFGSDFAVMYHLLHQFYHFLYLVPVGFGTYPGQNHATNVQYYGQYHTPLLISSPFMPKKIGL